MSKAHAGLEAKAFTDSSYAVEKYYCKSSGDLATSGCPDKAVGWYKKSNIPKACTAHEGELLGEIGKEQTGENVSSDTSSTAQ